METPRLFDEQSIRDELAQAVAEAVDDSCAGGGAGLEADELERVTQHVTGLLLAHPVIRRIQAEALREVADDWHEKHAGTRPVPYLFMVDRADRIERGETA